MLCGPFNFLSHVYGHRKGDQRSRRLVTRCGGVTFMPKGRGNDHGGSFKERRRVQSPG